MAPGRAIWVSAILFSLAALGPATAEPKRVMILHSFGRDFKPWSDYAKAIRMELDRQSQWALELNEHSLEIASSIHNKAEGPFVEYIRALLADRPLDLIVSIGAPAAAFVQRHRQQLFPATPMLLTVVDQRRVQYSILTDNDTVVAVAIDYFSAVENILRVLPDTKHVAMVVGDSPIERYWREEIAREVRPFENRIAFTWWNRLSFEDILKHAAVLPPRSAIFWELMIVDAAGVLHEEGKALGRLHAVANAPIFSYTDAFFGREIVGGPHVPVLEHGQQVAGIAVRILSGEKAGDIKIPPVGFTTPKFDWRQMQRWGISEDRLPPGSEIHFRAVTAWEQYRVHALATIALLFAQAGLIIRLLYERQQRRQSEAAAHALAGRLIHAHEEERSRLARELHDDVTQRLASLAIDAGREERNFSGTAGGNAMGTIREGLARLSEDVHSLSYQLHPSLIEDLGLIEALKAECERFSQRCPVQLDLNAQGVPDRFPRDVALCLFRVAQEGLRNIARHAGATHAEVSLRRLVDGLQLTVKDDGTGFDPALHRTRISLGHASMRQRVLLLGGNFDIDSSPGCGTAIRAWVPLKEEHSESPARAVG